MRFSLSSSRSSMSSSSSRSSTPPGCRDFRLRYAKDAKGHDLSSSYPHASASPSPLATCVSLVHVDANGTKKVFPVSCRDSVRLRYAKDGKGHDFAESYPAQFGVLDADEEEALVASAAAMGKRTLGCRDYRKAKIVKRYAKDGKGVDFEGTYKY